MKVVQNDLTGLILAAVAALAMIPSAKADSSVPDDGQAGVEATLA